MVPQTSDDGIIGVKKWLTALEKLQGEGATLAAKELYAARLDTTGITAQQEAQRRLYFANLYCCDLSEHEADQAFQNAIRAAQSITREAKPHIYVGNAYRCYGAWLAFSGNTSRAIGYLEKAVKKFMQASNTPNQFVAATALVLAKCYMQTDKTLEQPRKRAINILQYALNQAANSDPFRHRLTNYEIKACMLLGRLLWWDGDKTQSQALCKRAYAAAKLRGKGWPSYRHAFWLHWLSVPLYDRLFDQDRPTCPEI